MNLTWRLVKTDLRRQRLPLALWLASVVLWLTCAAYQLTLSVGPYWLWRLAGNLWGISFWATWGLTIVLTARFILADPLRGTTAFWFTRPIAGRGLLLAKTVEVGLLIAIPTLLQVAVLAGFGLGGRTLPIAALETAATLGVAVVATATFAALAESFGGFVLSAVIVLVTTAFCAVFASDLGYELRAADGERIVTDTLAISRLWIFKAAVLVLGGGFVSWQYFQRHTRLGMAIAWLGTFFMLILPSFWPWDFFQPEGPSDAGFSTARPTLTLSSPVMRATQLQSQTNADLVYGRPIRVRSPTRRSGVRASSNADRSDPKVAQR